MHQRHAQALLAEAREVWPKSDFIFSGRKLSHPNFARENRKARDRAGLHRVDFHGLRHSAGSRWLAHGFELIEVSRLLGHREISTTARWYLGISPGKLASRFDVMDEAAEATAAGRVVPLRPVER